MKDAITMITLEPSLSILVGWLNLFPRAFSNVSLSAVRGRPRWPPWQRLDHLVQNLQKVFEIFITWRDEKLKTWNKSVRLCSRKSTINSLREEGVVCENVTRHSRPLNACQKHFEIILPKCSLDEWFKIQDSVYLPFIPYINYYKCFNVWRGDL